MASSSSVVNEIASSSCVRGVATSVAGEMRTAFGCGAESQKVTSVRAGVAGKRRTPISSRNFT